MPGIKNVTEVRKIEESHDTQSPYNRQQSKSHLQVAKSAAKGFCSPPNGARRAKRCEPGYFSLGCEVFATCAVFPELALSEKLLAEALRYWRIFYLATRVNIAWKSGTVCGERNASACMSGS
jgi:hypothetical protein